MVPVVKSVFILASTPIVERDMTFAEKDESASMEMIIIPVMLWILFIFFRMGFKNVSDPSR